VSPRPADPAAELARVYDASAVAYDALPAHRDPSPPFAALRERFASSLAQGPVLDAGCGNGRDLPFFAARGLEPVGLDLSTGMLTIARSRFAGPLIQGDLRALPFADGAFTGVWACASLLHLKKVDLPQALAEIGRVLQAEGLLAAVVKAGHGERWEPNRYGDGERFFAFYEPSELDAALTAAGFAPLETRQVEIGDTDWLLSLARCGRSSSSVAR
jgi:SAM-dependent methyltransferase